MGVIVETNELTKAYRGRYAVQRVNLTVREGSVFGLLGPNGAGKTTLLKLLLGLLHPTSGQVRLFGEPWSRAHLARVGALIETPALYGHLTGRENLEVHRRLLNLPKARIDEVLHIVGLADVDERKRASQYSLGMKQRLGIAIALLNRPRLLILDELGRGTSTFDGLSIAWAVTEYIHDPQRLGCKALLATHYHELCRLEELLPGVKNYSVAVQEKGDEVVFLRKIVRGGSDRSYGIHVARLAGLPPEVVHRAREVLLSLESQEGAGQGEGPAPGRRPHPYRQLALFEPQSHPVLEELRALNILSTTPLEALNLLHRLKEKLSRPGESEGHGQSGPGGR
ncbi:MAG: ATP-binding cassette domain-containing protein [Acetobacteraceae bacterium]|nr:ATP-binding cassette domain-containing protein [Acetobacteraceae bacterium]